MYGLSAVPAGRCIRMRPTAANQCYAISELVRPWEVADLVQTVPEWLLPEGHTLAASVATWLRSQFATRRLRYLADPARPSGFDFWCSPAVTLERGGGDCDDLAILAASLLLAGGVDARVVVGTVRQGRRIAGHAWVEGIDEHGGFLIEATSGRLIWHLRPAEYRANVRLGPGCCELAA